MALRNVHKANLNIVPQLILQYYLASNYQLKYCSCIGTKFGLF